MEPKSPDHWTDDQLIAHLYGVGPDNQQHLNVCGDCKTRLSRMQSVRQNWTAEEVSPDLLAAQRRSIYGRLTKSETWFAETWFAETWFAALHWRRWASAGAVSLLLGAGVVWYQEHETQQIYDDTLSDAQLAQDVSTMAQNTEAQPTAPLQALFEE